MKWVAALLGLVFLVIACSPPGPTCTDPYIANGNTCCLDSDEDGICDVDSETESSGETAVSCDLCPPRFETIKEEVIVYKYVCFNGTVVDNQEECSYIVRSNAHLFELSTQQNPDYISEFTARPACRGEFQSAELHLVLNQPPREIILQAKSNPAKGYSDLTTIQAEGDVFDDEYFYVGFCRDIECGQITHTQLSSDSAHVIRARLIYSDGAQTTHDVLVDPTPEGSYGKKSC